MVRRPARDWPNCGSDGGHAAGLQELDHLGSWPAHAAPERHSDRKAGLLDHPPCSRPADPTVELDVADIPVLGRPQVDDRIVLTRAHTREMRACASRNATPAARGAPPTHRRSGPRRPRRLPPAPSPPRPPRPRRQRPPAFSANPDGVSSRTVVLVSKASRSDEQMRAEREIRAQLAKDLDVEWREDHAVKMPLPNGTKPEVDAVSTDGMTLVEIYAHQGPLKGGQVHKVARDALKLITVARTQPGASLHIAFASNAAHQSVTGWLAEALDTWGVKTRAVEVSQATRDELEAAQQRQRMVNISGEDELSGDDLRTLSEDDE